MRYRFMAVTAMAALVVAALVIAMVAAAQPGRSAPSFQARPLVGASDEEVIQYALEWTQVHYVVEGDLNVRFSKATSYDEVHAIGLLVGNPRSAGRDYHTVIVEGDVVRPATTLHPEEAYRFVAYVFDMQEGIPTYVLDDPDGSSVKLALDDPTLPDLKLPPPMPIDSAYDPPDPLPAELETDLPPADIPLTEVTVTRWEDEQQP